MGSRLFLRGQPTKRKLETLISSDDEIRPKVSCMPASSFDTFALKLLDEQFMTVVKGRR